MGLRVSGLRSVSHPIPSSTVISTALPMESTVVARSYNRLMRRSLAVLVLLTTLAGCGDRSGGRNESQSGAQKTGLSLSVSFDEPLREGKPVTWKLRVDNAGPGDVTLTFRSGKDGDVALVQGGREAYRWSAAKFFSQAMRQEPLKAGESRTFSLEEKALSAAPGDYELLAELASEPAPPPARQTVKVSTSS
jgi:hypothetical protein